MKKIILLGYMGCGKSTIANLLSQTTKIPFIDLDQAIEKKLSLSIKEIFEQKGEIYFRKIEHEVFLDLLQSPTQIILGLGGGTPCYANNHLLLQDPNVLSVYLQASVATLCGRLKLQKENRPLIAAKTNDELLDFVGQHLLERSYYYHFAQHKVAVDALTIPETVTAIQALF